MNYKDLHKRERKKNIFILWRKNKKELIQSVSEYLREFSKKFETVLMRYSGAGGKLIHEKNQKQKILWHSPFKRIHLWIWRDLLLASLSCSCLLEFVLGSSNFPRSLCFLWFWFGLEILGLVNKKWFLILNSFYLIWPFNFQKIAPSISKSWKKMSLKLGAESIKRSWILHWF